MYGAAVKKFIKPIKSMTELLMWEDKIKEIAPLSIKAFFVIALDTGISPQFLLNLKWEDIKTEAVGTAIQRTEPYFDVYCELAKETRKIYFCDASLAVMNELRENYPNDIYIFQPCQERKRRTSDPPCFNWRGFQRSGKISPDKRSGRRFSGHSPENIRISPRCQWFMVDPSADTLF